MEEDFDILAIPMDKNIVIEYDTTITRSTSENDFLQNFNPTTSKFNKRTFYVLSY